jgi:hypothetical protein
VTNEQWLKEQFEYEYCSECGGDAQHHTVVSVLGNPFARCDYPPTIETDWEMHPVIIAFRRAEEMK